MDSRTTSAISISTGRLGGLDPQRVAVVVPHRQRRRAEVDHGRVPGELGLEGRADRVPERLWAGPVRRAIDGAAIAERDRHVRGDRGGLELALHEVDRALRRAPGGLGGVAGEAAAEQDAGRFGEHAHVLAQRLSYELEHGRLSGSRPTREHDPLGAVCLRAVAVDHRVTPAPRSSRGRGRSRSIRTCRRGGGGTRLPRSVRHA